MPLDTKDEFFIGEWLIQPDQYRIRGKSGVTRIEPKVMGVLICLANQTGETVSREYLLEHVWAGTIVTDDVLTRSISELRKAFKDDARNPAIIETIPKIGYRLIEPRRPDHRGDSAPPEIPTVTLSPSSDHIVRTESLQQIPLETATASKRWYLPASLGAVFLLMIGLLYNNLVTEPPTQALIPFPLTTYPGQEGRPILSPAGNHVAFSWSGPDGDNVDIYVKLVGTDTPLQLTDSPHRDFMPAWSPDGRQIAYMQKTDQGCDIYLVEPLGGPSKRLASCGANIYGDLTWSPDGKWLAYNDKSSASDPFHLVLLSPTSLEKQSITTPPAGSWGDHDPAFSPDGKQLSFTRSLSEGMQDMYTLSLSSFEATRLTFDSRNISGHTWSSNNATIIFSSNRTGKSGLWRISADGGTPKWIGIGNGPTYFPHVAATRLAFMMGSGQTNIWLKKQEPTEDGEAVDTAATAVISSTWWDLHPQWSPDGQHIAFTSNRTGNFEIWMANKDGNEQRRLTNFNGPFTSTPRWSPDGQHLLFTSRPDGQADIYLQNIHEATPIKFTTESTDEMAASWSRDGQFVYFSSNREGMWNVWRAPVRGGKAIRMTNNGGFGAVESTDGKDLYFARHNATGLWKIPVQGGNPILALRDLDPRDWGNWKISNNGLFYVQRGQPSQIVFLNFTSNKLDTLFTPRHHLPWMDPAFDVSLNGDVLFGQNEHRETDLMYVDGFR